MPYDKKYFVTTPYKRRKYGIGDKFKSCHSDDNENPVKSRKP